MLKRLSSIITDGLRENESEAAASSSTSEPKPTKAPRSKKTRIEEPKPAKPQKRMRDVISEDEESDNVSVATGLTAIMMEDQDLGEEMEFETKTAYNLLGNMAAPFPKDASCFRFLLSDDFSHRKQSGEDIGDVTDLVHVTPYTAKIINWSLSDMLVNVAKKVPDTFAVKNGCTEEEKKLLHAENTEFFMLRSVLEHYPGCTQKTIPDQNPCNMIEILLNQWIQKDLVSFHVEVLDKYFLPVKFLVGHKDNIINFYRSQANKVMNKLLLKAVVLVHETINRKSMLESTDETGNPLTENIDAMLCTVVRMLYEYYFTELERVLRETFTILHSSVFNTHNPSIKDINENAIQTGKRRGTNKEAAERVVDDIYQKYSKTVRSSYVEDGFKINEILSDICTPEALVEYGIASSDTDPADLANLIKTLSTPKLENAFADFYPLVSVDLWTILFLGCDWNIINDIFVNKIIAAFELNSLNTPKIKRPRTSAKLSDEERASRRTQQLQVQNQRKLDISEERRTLLLEHIQRHVSTLVRQTNSNHFNKFLVLLAGSTAMTYAKQKDRLFIGKICSDWNPTNKRSN